MPDIAEKWFAQAAYDFQTAKAMFRSRRYIYAVFMCHLSLEKALKGLVAAVTGEIPPRTHNLIYLAKLAEPRLSKEQTAFLATINTASIVTRYPEDLESTLKEYSRRMVRKYIRMTEEVLKCLHRDPRLKK
ncbi:MAG: HEPN domain-containing protein [Bacillota bacterium]